LHLAPKVASTPFTTVDERTIVSKVLVVPGQSMVVAREKVRIKKSQPEKMIFSGWDGGIGVEA